MTTGYNTGVENYNKAISAYDPLSSLANNYNKAGDLHLDAMGVNGPEAAARVQGAFTSNTGYDLINKAAMEAIDRRRAIGGMYASGNADQDTIDYVTKNIYGTQYQPWLQGLQSAGQTGLATSGTVAAGQAGGYGSLASLAERLAGNQVGVSGNVLGQDVNANNLQAAGEAQGAKNLLGAGLSLASLAFGGAGGGMGLSSLGSGLSSAGSNLFGSVMGNQWQQNNAGRWGSSYYGPVA